MTAAPTPIEAYHQAVAQGDFVVDPAQWHAAECLEACHRALHADTGPIRSVQGVYLWGPVGRGKTWLMDRFQQSLRVPSRRQHFHHFMQWVHRRLFQLTGTADPLQALALELSQDVRVLCFDELLVNDIGDAIILGRLFQAMFTHGVVLVATSNLPPEQLYADGFNRERFMPAIAALDAHMQVVSVDGGQDHRLHPGRHQQRYWLSRPGQASALADVFATLSAGQAISHGALSLGHRRIESIQYSKAALWCHFADLCVQPLSALDFIALCDRFPAVLLSDVPLLSSTARRAGIARGTEDGVLRVAAGDRELPALSVHDDSVRRFIALVDECYDRHVPVYLEAQVALEELYTEGYLSFAFQRTRSRLQEMQLQRFGRTGERSPQREPAIP